MIIGTNVYQTAARIGGIEGHEGKITVDNYLESVKNIVNLGYKQVELLCDPILFAMTEDELSKLMEELLKFKESLGIEYSVHLPFWWQNVAVPDKNVRKSSVKVMKDCIALTRILQPTHFVLHVFQGIFGRITKSLAEEGVKKKATEMVYNNACESIEEILSTLDDPAQLCIENLLKSNINYLVTLMEKYNTSFCYDIGHKYMADMDEISFLETYKDRIKAIHSHNIKLVQLDKGNPRIYKMDDHYSISEGPMDFDRVIRTLKKINYQNSLIVEVKRHEDAANSAEYLKAKGLL